MLPFLQKKQQTGVIVKERQPDEHAEPKSDIEECIKDILKACEAKDIKALAHLFRELHDELHKEMDKGQDDSYEAMNEKAGEE